MPKLNIELDIPNIGLKTTQAAINQALKDKMAEVFGCVDLAKAMKNSSKCLKNAKAAFVDGKVNLSVTIATKNIDNYSINGDRALALIRGIVDGDPPVMDEPELSEAGEHADPVQHEPDHDEPEDDADDANDTVPVAESLELEPEDEAPHLEPLAEPLLSPVEPRADNLAPPDPYSFEQAEEDDEDEVDGPHDEFEPAKKGPVVVVRKPNPLGKYILASITTAVYGFSMYKILG